MDLFMTETHYTELPFAGDRSACILWTVLYGSVLFAITSRIGMPFIS
jgi:hypothetical protein